MATWVQATSDGQYVLGGNTSSINGDVTSYHGGIDVWVIKFNGAGVLQWQKTYGGNNSDELNYIQQTSDGGYIISGSTASAEGDITLNQGGTDVWIIKLGGTLETDGFAKDELVIFPNPGSTVIYLQNTNQSDIKNVRVTDMLGKTVLESQNTASINIENLAKGLYLLEAFSENKVYKSKFVKN